MRRPPPPRQRQGWTSYGYGQTAAILSFEEPSQTQKRVHSEQMQLALGWAPGKAQSCTGITTNYGTPSAPCCNILTTMRVVFIFSPQMSGTSGEDAMDFCHSGWISMYPHPGKTGTCSWTFCTIHRYSKNWTIRPSTGNLPLSVELAQSQPLIARLVSPSNPSYIASRRLQSRCKHTFPNPFPGAHILLSTASTWLASRFTPFCSQT